jgi:hypothetical protein
MEIESKAIMGDLELDEPERRTRKRKVEGGERTDISILDQRELKRIATGQMSKGALATKLRALELPRMVRNRVLRSHLVMKNFMNFYHHMLGEKLLGYEKAELEGDTEVMEQEKAKAIEIAKRIRRLGHLMNVFEDTISRRDVEGIKKFYEMVERQSKEELKTIRSGNVPESAIAEFDLDLPIVENIE